MCFRLINLLLLCPYAMDSKFFLADIGVQFHFLG